MPPIIERPKGASAPKLPPLLDSEEAPSTRLGDIEYGQLRGRLVRTLDSIGLLFRRVFAIRPSADSSMALYRAFRENGDQLSLSPLQKSLYEYHVASALHFHRVCSLSEQSADSGISLVLSAGSAELDERLLADVKHTVDCSAVELAYRFLAKSRSFPAGFLERALIPHLIEMAMTRYGVSAECAENAVRSCTEEVGMNSSSKITFERILEIKNRLRWMFADDNRVAENSRTGPASPAGPKNSPLHRLDPPSVTRYTLDHEDREYIQRVVDGGGCIKLHRHDTANRVKRFLLRNKRKIVLSAFAMSVSAIVAGVATGGVGAVVSIATYIVWSGLWSGGSELIRMTRAIRALQQAEASADYALAAGELGVLSEIDEKKFRTFLKSLRYICSHETLTRIFHAYSDLEKDAEMRSKVRVDNSDLDSVIRLAEGDARYIYRRNRLREALRFYHRFCTTAVNDVKRMDAEWEPVLDVLWQNKFKNMPEQQRQALFSRAAGDRRLFTSKKQFDTKRHGWLKAVFPGMGSAGAEAPLTKESAEALDYILIDEFPDLDQLTRDQPFITHSPGNLSKGLAVVKRGVEKYALTWLKGAVKKTVSHGFRFSWHAINHSPKIEFSPHLPRPSVDGAIIFAVFFLASQLVDYCNRQVNRERFEQMTGKEKKGKLRWDWFGSGKRTGRQEVNTIRKLAKDDLEGFSDSVLALHDLHRKIMREINLHRRIDGITSKEEESLDSLSDYEAAVLILKRQQHHQIVTDMMMGAVGQYYQKVVANTAEWDQKVGVDEV